MTDGRDRRDRRHRAHRRVGRHGRPPPRSVCTCAATGRKAPLGVERGALDEACADLASALDGRRRRDRLRAGRRRWRDGTREVLAAAPPGCAVTDVGSTKQAVVAAAGDDERFVGGHPLAGAEVAGVEHAREDLFDGATWYLTPQPTTSGVLFERVHKLLIPGIGAHPQVVDPADPRPH